MKKQLLSVVLAASMLFGMAACGTSGGTGGTDSDQQTTDEIGKVVIGIDGAYPPYNYIDDDNNPTGLEIEMINEIAKRANLEVEFQALPWDGIFGQMDSGKIDTVACCIFPNAERQEKYLFSSEYIYDENRFITRKGDGSLYKTYADLKGKKVGTTGGGNTMMTLEKLLDEVDFEIVAYNSENYVNDLALERVDLIYKSPVSAFVQAESLGCEFELAECPTVESSSCALPWRKNDERAQKICDKFSEATKEMIEDGTMKKLCDKWLGMDLTAYEPLFDF